MPLATVINLKLIYQQKILKIAVSVNLCDKYIAFPVTVILFLPVECLKYGATAIGNEFAMT